MASQRKQRLCPFVWPDLHHAGAGVALSLRCRRRAGNFLCVGGLFCLDPVNWKLTGASTIFHAGGRPAPAIAGFLLGSLRGLFVFLLALAIIAGFIGTQNAYRNLNMTLFWVVFVLGFTYLTAVFGNWFAVLNPLRVIAEWIEKLSGRKLQGRWPYPQKMAYWPALILYMGFIWLELFGRSTPMSLSVVLLGYTLISLLGSYLLGKEPWFKYCEFFSVFLRLVGKMAPLAIDAPGGKFQKAYLRMPLAGLLQQKAIPLSLLVFVLFMLSSTAFDGLHETALWVGAFWKNLYQMLLFPIYGSAPPVTLPTIRKLFLIYQSGALLLSPLVYLAIYALFLFIAKVLASSRRCR